MLYCQKSTGDHIDKPDNIDGVISPIHSWIIAGRFTRAQDISEFIEPEIHLLGGQKYGRKWNKWIRAKVDTGSRVFSLYN